MDKSRITFFEDFDYFVKYKNYAALYFQSKTILGYTKTNQVLYLVWIALFLVAMLGAVFFNIHYILFICILSVSVVLYLLASYLDIVHLKKELKKKGLSAAPQFYKWRCKALENERIHTIYPDYDSFSENVIEKRITIAQELKSNMEKEPMYSVFRILEFFGKNIFTIAAGLVLAYYQNQKISEPYLLLGTLIISACILAVLRTFLVKKSIRENTLQRAKNLEDYIFVLRNILLIRKIENQTQAVHIASFALQ